MKLIENSKNCLKRAAKWYLMNSAAGYTCDGYTPRF